MTAAVLLARVRGGAAIPASGRVERERGADTGLRWTTLALEAVGDGPERRGVVMALARSAGRLAVSWCGADTLAARVGDQLDRAPPHRHTVARTLAALVRAGLVVVLARPRRRGRVVPPAHALLVPRAGAPATWAAATRSAARELLAELEARRRAEARRQWPRDLDDVIDELGRWASDMVSDTASDMVSDMDHVAGEPRNLARTSEIRPALAAGRSRIHIHAHTSTHQSRPEHDVVTDHGPALARARRRARRARA